ncbi:MAG TPA: transcription antitermination factor NusB, partial [Desulfobacteria bacterium]|nr:transcription antitermination factor NusB [Desulfobacteria bacterium]
MAKKSARDMALEALYAVLNDGAFSNIALNRVLEKYQPEKIDRGFITEIVYGSLRTLNTLDWILNQYLKKTVDDLPARIRNILRMGVYQLIYMEKVPDSAACNESANLAKLHGHAGTVKLVNGVLRNIARNKQDIALPDIAIDPVKGISLKYSHPEWLVSRLIKEYGPDGAEEFCRANNVIPPNSIRTNTLKTTRDELKEILTEEGVSSSEGRFAPETLVIEGFKSVGSIAAHKSGLFMVQDESSTLV